MVKPTEKSHSYRQSDIVRNPWSSSPLGDRQLPLQRVPSGTYTRQYMWVHLTYTRHICPHAPPPKLLFTHFPMFIFLSLFAVDEPFSHCSWLSVDLYHQPFPVPHKSGQQMYHLRVFPPGQFFPLYSGQRMCRPFSKPDSLLTAWCVDRSMNQLIYFCHLSDQGNSP